MRKFLRHIVKRVRGISLWVGRLKNSRALHHTTASVFHQVQNQLNPAGEAGKNPRPGIGTAPGIRMVYIVACAILLLPASFYFGVKRPSASDTGKSLGKPDSRVVLADGRDLTLPDGSRVRLSRGSRFMYAPDFSQKRETYLHGRASFDVKPDKDRPFIIHAGATTLEMLGTRFDVTSDNDGRKGKIMLIKGEVRVTHGNIQALLHTGEQAITNEAGMIIRKWGRPERTLVWTKAGTNVEFDSVYLEQVLNEMATWYQVKVFNPDHLRGKRISGNFLQKAPLDTNLTALQYIENWHIQLERRNDTIFLTKSKP